MWLPALALIGPYLNLQKGVLNQVVKYSKLNFTFAIEVAKKKKLEMLVKMLEKHLKNT